MLLTYSVTGEFGDTGDLQLRESNNRNKFERNQVYNNYFNNYF